MLLVFYLEDRLVGAILGVFLDDLGGVSLLIHNHHSAVDHEGYSASGETI